MRNNDSAIVIKQPFTFSFVHKECLTRTADGDNSDGFAKNLREIANGTSDTKKREVKCI